eukprot:3931847-Rhodomonas_salina.1
MAAHLLLGLVVCVIAPIARDASRGGHEEGVGVEDNQVTQLAAVHDDSQIVEKPQCKLHLRCDAE